MNWKFSIWCKKCPDNLKNVSGYSKKSLDNVKMYLENLEGSGWSRKCPLNSENCTDNLKRVRMIKKYAWVIWISYKCTLWSIFGPLLCLKFATTLFTRICCKFENWCDILVLSGKFLRQKSCCGKFLLFLTLHANQYDSSERHKWSWTLISQTYNMYHHHHHMIANIAP